MNIEIVSVVHNEQRQCLEVVKEITDNVGTSSFFLHVLPNEIFNNLAVEHDVGPDEAIDIALFGPHLTEVDKGETATKRVQNFKQRASAKISSPNEVNKRLRAKGIPEKYWPRAEDALTPIDYIKDYAKVTQKGISEARLNRHNRQPKQPPHMESTQGLANKAPTVKPNRTHVTLGINKGQEGKQVRRNRNE